MTQCTGISCVFNDFFKATHMTQKSQFFFGTKDGSLQQNVFRILACARQLQKKSCGRLFADYQAIISRLPII